MPKPVEADLVTALENLAEDRAASRHLLTNHEEGRMRALWLKRFQDRWRAAAIRAVVESE
jgi:hypothetical protein